MNESVLQVLALTQSVKTNIIGANASNMLVLSQVTVSGLEAHSLSNTLSLRHAAFASKTISVTATNALVLSQSEVPFSFPESLEQFLFIWHEAIIEKTKPLATSVLSLSQEAVCYTAKGALNVLVFQQVASASVDKVQVIEHTLNLSSKVNVFKPSKYWNSLQ